jgi:ADP-ribosylglycohydrolase/fructose-1,6-bisphosphatase/inositol monophosphatase family enzyme
MRMTYDRYGELLEVATVVACDAGAILRADFLQPGGPRGEGEHADADDEAEALIRARLLAATPDWSYRGEETGFRPGTEGHHIWLVDPNDATSAYLKGYRGSAVSIALLRDGVPVLGVVNAYAAPDNDGDLFAWAEGCGQLRRNGVPVEPRSWPSELTSGSVAIVSYAAEKAPRENLANVSPARYRTETSIAYRLALLAAGEGDVCVCLSGAGDWDYAGGHALLRSCGGTLVDQDGAPVKYTRDGRSHTRYCFGGAPGVTAELARRDWEAVEAAARNAIPDRYDLCRPGRGETIAGRERLQRVQGCWLGQLTGDALGSMVEFKSAAEIRRKYPDGLREIGPSPVWHTLAGQPTDDSELGLMLARTLLADGGYVEQRVRDAYRWWRDSAPFDVGTTIGAALKGHSSPRSQANGALMRQSPLAIWGHALPPEELAEIVRTDTRLTHPHSVCVDASAAFIVTLAAVIREGLDAPEAHRRALEWSISQDAVDSVIEALQAALHSPPDHDGKAGWVLVALQSAFYVALHTSSFEEGIVATVMSGGDTDTNAAIAGALLGAIHSAPAVPRQWRESVLTCRPQAGAAQVLQPRPRAFWPVDALLLSERLAFKGGPL